MRLDELTFPKHADQAGTRLKKAGWNQNAIPNLKPDPIEDLNWIELSNALYERFGKKE